MRPPRGGRLEGPPGLSPRRRRSTTGRRSRGLRAVRQGRAAACGPLGRGPTRGRSAPAVTLTVAKRKGTNAVVVADRVLAKVESLRGILIPHDVHVTVTRNYGETASDKSNELLKHLFPGDALGRRARSRCSWAGAIRGRGADRHPGDARADPAPLLPLRLHAEPGHAVRPDLFHRHPGGRRHRGGGEHRRATSTCPRTAVDRGPRSPWRRWTKSAIPPSSPPSR